MVLWLGSEVVFDVSNFDPRMEICLGEEGKEAAEHLVTMESFCVTALRKVGGMRHD